MQCIKNFKLHASNFNGNFFLTCLAPWQSPYLMLLRERDCWAAKRKSSTPEVLQNIWKKKKKGWKRKRTESTHIRKNLIQEIKLLKMGKWKNTYNNVIVYAFQDGVPSSINCHWAIIWQKCDTFKHILYFTSKSH